jgi:hypothetical protein
LAAIDSISSCQLYCLASTAKLITFIPQKSVLFVCV